ncbi:hydroxymethylbilane synthase [Streptomyces katrae]|uniref:hydroxymethylbilane synthase n=1 Tax=Streptomyces katrae TaxID=68223 RepID=UPI0006897942|nr:hydroxymethylbilane synthase [Streptomyces katrae]
MNVFESVAADHSRYRPGVPEDAVQLRATALTRIPEPTVAELGAGTGQVAHALLPLLPPGAHLDHVDRDEGMLRTAFDLLRPDFRQRTVVFHPVPAEGFDPLVPGYQADLITCCRAFHWMDRPAVLAMADRLTGPPGAVAIMGDGSLWTRQADWTRALKGLIQSDLGSGRRAGTTGTYTEPGRRFEEDLAESAFTDVTLAVLGTAFHRLVLHADPAPLSARIGASCEYLQDALRSEAVRARRHRRIAEGRRGVAARRPGDRHQQPLPRPGPPGGPRPHLSRSETPPVTTPATQAVVRLGTRPSPMAMEQTGRFAEAFRARHPQLTLDILKITSEGDAHFGPLSQIGGKGAFTRRGDACLLDGRVDATIACAKDLPGPHDRAPGMAVAAVLPREDVRDVLVLPAGHRAVALAELPPGTRVGTSAPRRAALLAALYPQLVPVPIRGNADRRLDRLDRGDLGADAMIAALAGLRRLGLEDRASVILDPSEWMPAAGAGIVVIEHRIEDIRTRDLLAPLTHAPTRALFDAERVTLATLKGGCLTAASVHAILDPATLQITLQAAVLDPNGGPSLRTTVSGPLDTAAELGQEAGQRLLEAGAGLLLAVAP